MDRGQLTGHQVTGCRFILEDGAAHAVDSSELAFRLAGLGAFKEAFGKAAPVVMEPVMKVEIVAPSEFQGEFSVWIAIKRSNLTGAYRIRYWLCQPTERHHCRH